MFCILPFEVEFFRNLDYPVDYVGNPSVDSVACYREKQAVGPDTFREDEQLDERPVLALLAGSRRQEIKDNLPTMLKVAAAYPGHQPVIAGAPGLEPEYYRQYIGDADVKIVFGKTYPLLSHSDAALVTSGRLRLRHRFSVCRKSSAIMSRPAGWQVLFSAISSIRNTFRWSI